MVTRNLGFVIGGAVCVLCASLAPAYAGYLDPCPAPLPGLGVTLLGQAAAGALGWKLFRKRRK